MLADELIHGINISKPKYVFVSKQVYKIHYETLKSMDVIEKIVLYDDVPKSNDCLRYRDLTEKYVDITTYKAVKYNGKWEKNIVTNILYYFSYSLMQLTLCLSELELYYVPKTNVNSNYRIMLTAMN